MCCEERQNAAPNEITGTETLVENFHELYMDGLPNNEQNTASLFGQSFAQCPVTTQGTGTVEDEAAVIHAMMLQRIGSLMTLDSNMTDATKHAQLQNNLINHVCRQS